MSRDNTLSTPLGIFLEMSHTTEKRAVDNATIEMLQSRMLQVSLPVLFSIIFSFSIPLNSLSLWFLCRYSRPWTPIIVFCINLTMADLVYSMVLPFQIIYHMKGNNWPFDDILCRMVTVLSYGNMHCSILTMMSISIERYFGVVHPLRYKTIKSVRSAVLSCVIIWTLVLLPLIPFMKSNLAIHIQQLPIITCFDVLPREMFNDNVTYFIIYFGSLLFFFFFIPLFVMGFCYISIIWTLLHTSSAQLRETKKHTVYLIIVLLLLVVFCYLPHIILATAHFISISGKQSRLYVAYKLSFALASLNCCFDPFVYYFGSKEFRLKVQRKLCRCVARGFSENTPIFSDNDIQVIPIQKAPKAKSAGSRL